PRIAPSIHIPICHHLYSHHIPLSILFFFNDTPPTEIYTLSLHDALPISCTHGCYGRVGARPGHGPPDEHVSRGVLRRCRQLYCSDRKSTRLNSSHVAISYAVFCLKKKKNIDDNQNKRK